jgi:RimJ/RimL family protein N-acetyltransferase
LWQLQIKKVVSTSLQRASRRLALRDPIANVLVLGDLYSPLCRASDIYCAVENHRIEGICSVYRAFSTPSVVFSNARVETKRALLRRALNGVSADFISLCHPNDVDLFKEHTTILHNHSEQQMVANPPKRIKSEVEAVRVRKDEVELLNDFYVNHHAEAWTPIQFKTGPYYCIKHGDRIISAAGVHIVTPQIAQLGNIVTDEAYRNRGFATSCTSALAADLASKGRIISLFVRADNAPAIHMYKKLEFYKKGEVVFLVMRKNI